MPTSQPSPTGWRKSSYSGDGPTCVEVGGLEQGRAVRDSKNPGLGFLAFGAPEWRAFLSALRAGDLAG
ncbi:DUF397 domain-containing protein [Actinorugispora endophytica]|uniref:Uncharacterized protein DUF397 n=1 Tax=Actinorugispora endophytica TaxID=1605990 RepID=A0A4R6V2N6_9ACTN|nr:DUF397 domain-containing protein [Actinorugispora endophytica]TDQ54300.1 uncharacterized protein DUF397 [Actinorugispora endophytica]